MFKYFSLEVPVEKSWIFNLMEQYKESLILYHKEQKAVRKHLIEASEIFLEMELILPHELTYQWLDTKFEVHNTTRAKRSLRAFLKEQKLIKEPDGEVKYRQLFERSLNECPIGFKKAIVLYYEEKFKLHKRQIELNASSPVKLTTVEADVGVLKRMVKWMKPAKIHCFEYFI